MGVTMIIGFSVRFVANHVIPILQKMFGIVQCCGSGSGSTRIHINFGRLDPHREYGSGSRKAKKTHKSEERKFKF